MTNYGYQEESWDAHLEKNEVDDLVKIVKWHLAAYKPASAKIVLTL